MNHRTARRRGAVFACLFALAAAQVGIAQPGEAAELKCRTESVVVRAPIRDDAADACRGAAAAIQFFKSLDLRTDEAISIDIVPELPQRAGASAAGCFLASDRRVLVLSYRKFKAMQTWFAIPIDRRLYRSVATHEVAHALASCNFRIPAPSIQATEYVAYVATFATMSEPQRRIALTAYPGAGFADEAKMSAVIYMLDPMRFGVEAYRHYLQPENGKSFLYAVLAGAVLAE